MYAPVADRREQGVDGTAPLALRDLRDSTLAKAAGLDGPHLLDRGDPAGVVYSFSLYERGEGVNRLAQRIKNILSIRRKR